MSADRFSVAHRLAVVTGASSGIGRHIAQTWARAGARVVLVARRRARLEALAAEIRGDGGQAEVVAADLAVGAELGQAVDAIEGIGPVEILLNAAGTNPRSAAHELTLSAWQKTLDLNLTAPFRLAQDLVPAMLERGWGRVINIASLQSLRAFPRGMAYGATKGGIAQLTRAMAREWSGRGVTCNAIAPGFFPTELTEALTEDPAGWQELASKTLVGRNGRLEDLEGPALFLASPASNYVTGQVLFVDGGFSAG